MILTINIPDLNAVHLSLNGYFICYTVHNNREDILMNYIQANGSFKETELTKLKEDGWIKIKNEEKNEKIIFKNLETTEKFRIFVENKTNQSKDWIDEWYNMFPKGIKSGGYYVKSDLPGCKKKMTKFIAQHPEYNQEIILKATSNYISNCEKKGYQYMKIAPYFIEKDGISVLAGECEAINDNIDNYNNEFTRQI